MKKIVLMILAIALLMPVLVTPAIAGTTDRQITFSWDDTNFKENGYHWTLFMREEGTSYDYEAIPAATIAWEPGDVAGTYYCEDTFEVTGQGGATVKKYFVLRVVTASGESSGDSNEVNAEFQIPLDPAFNFTVTVNVVVTNQTATSE